MNSDVRTFEQMADDDPGTIYYDELVKTSAAAPCRLLVTKGSASCCAYLCVPLDHPLVRDMPNSESAAEKLAVHGGITFAEAGNALIDPVTAGWFLYGWDYCHSGDKPAYQPDVRSVLEAAKNRAEMSAWFRLGDSVPFEVREKAWTPFQVRQEALQAVAQFGELMAEAEQRVRMP